jgi:hypothetical protein
MNETPWDLQGNPLTEIPEGYVGFVYMIVDTHTKKAYIGKKGFYHNITRPPLKGSSRKRHDIKESEWRTYYGSNKAFQAVIDSEGADRARFERVILRLCRTKAEMGYFETKEIFARDALLSDMYWNDWVTCKITREQMKSKANKSMKPKYRNFAFAKRSYH